MESKLPFISTRRSQTDLTLTFRLLKTEKFQTDRQVERLIHTKSLCLDLPLLNVL